MFFILALLVAASFAVAADWNDYASEPSQVQVEGKSYYEITSAGELAWFSKQVASGKTEINAVLKNDIALWDSVSGDTNYWNPIGPSNTLAFEGVFDGNGKTISGDRYGIVMRHSALGKKTEVLREEAEMALMCSSLILS